MRKKRILMCTEFSKMPTGYSVYSKEVLSRLHKHYPEFEVAELACYITQNDKRVKDVPWKVFANEPEKHSPERAEYDSNPIAEFGEFSFNSVLLNYKPDIVFDIRDFWMLSYEGNSPFRDFYNWSIMPTVDASPQNMEWVEAYAEADAVFTYSEFGRDTLLSQSNNINYIDVAPPCASDSFFFVEDKNKHRNKFGLSSESFIVGTVMRNQRRKLYPDLFKAFKKFSRDRDNALLYCHTAYPDLGWEIPDLIIKNELSNKVLFTYKCKQCKSLSCSFFSDSVKFCRNCNTYNNVIAGLNNPVSEEELNEIYNLFTVYVQYANSEGFGMPQLEAAKCGLPICTVGYSAMESIANNISALKIQPSSLLLEIETGCDRAVPDNNYFVSLLEMLYGMSSDRLKQMGLETKKLCDINYDWDKTADIWAKHFMSVPLKPEEQTWYSPPKILESAPFIKEISHPIDQANFLINEVLCKPEWVGKHIWRRLLRDLTYKKTSANIGGYYINESHHKDPDQNTPFSFSDAYDNMKKLREYYNIWERHRTS